MSESTETAPQNAPQTPADRKLAQLNETIEKTWSALTEATLECGLKKHAHQKLTHEAHRHTPEEIMYVARERRQAEADAAAALEACVDAQVAMYREMDSRATQG